METGTSAVVPLQRNRPVEYLIEIAIPIYNEEKVLAESVHRLRQYLKANLPHSFVITIADNGSTDSSWDIATRLSEELPDVTALRVPLKGRGGAIRHAWAQSKAPIVAYMDVDLSIDLDAFAPLVASVISGHSDLAIGTRYAQGSFVDRSLKRAFFSRSFNYLLRNALGARFSDGMCGFKAARRDAIEDLLPSIDDNKWFFDVEMLLFAQRNGLRIHEVPVLCIDDPNTTVHVVRDSVADLKAMARVAPRLTGGVRDTGFRAVWALTTAMYAVLYVVFRDIMPALGANTLALTIAAFLNTLALRQFSYGVRGAARAIRYQLNTWFDFGVRLVLTTVGIIVVHSTWPDATLVTECVAVFALVAGSSSIRFLLVRGREPSTVPNPVPIRPVPATDQRTAA